MLSKETLEWYRQMSPNERLRLTFISCREQEKYFFIGSPELTARKFEALRITREASKQAMLKGLLEAEAKRHEFGY